MVRCLFRALLILVEIVPDTLLEACFRQIERPQPQEHDIRSVNRWLSGNKPFTAEESTFLSNWDDLTAPIPLVSHTALETFVEACAVILHSRGYSTVCPILFKDSLVLELKYCVQIFTAKV